MSTELVGKSYMEQKGAEDFLRMVDSYHRLMEFSKLIDNIKFRGIPFRVIDGDIIWDTWEEGELIEKIKEELNYGN